MPDEIKRLQNELVSVYQQGRDCGATFEDSEIIAAYEAAIEALEKQKPKIVPYAFANVNSDKRIYGCPRCEHWIPRKGRKYCEYCGQALDWTEVDE